MIAFGHCPATAAEGEGATIAVFDINGPIVESSNVSLDLSTLLGGATGGGVLMFDLVHALRQAEADDGLKALVFDIDQAGAELAQLQELASHFAALRAAGKDVWLFTESLGNPQAILGRAASEIVLMPEGDVSVSGLYSEQLYFKDLMDRVGVKANVIHIGDFKSAGENYYLSGPSESARAQTRALMESQFEQLVRAVAGGRKLDPERVRGLIDRGILGADEAAAAGLVDRLLYRTDFVKMLRDKYGEDSQIDYAYRMPVEEDAEIGSLFDLMKLAMGSKSKPRRERGTFIDVIVLEGTISDATVAPVRKEILRAARDEGCAAVVFRINSPGGSAMASDVLWEATDELRAAGKPLVVSMGGVAASGGYYVAAAADRIFADAGTVTGSIGVVGMKFDFSGVLEWAGVHTHREKFGARADLDTMTRAFSDDEEALIRDSMGAVYRTFKKRITDGRGERIKGELEALAGGRVYTGEQALELGLIDGIGGLSQAIDYAVEKSATGEGFKLRLRPEPVSLFEIFGGGAGDEGGEFIEFSHPDKSAGSRLRKAVEAQFGALGFLPSAQRAGIESFLEQLEQISDSRIWLVSPDLRPSLR
jgi:protease-4